MENINELTEALVMAQSEMTVATKNSKNPHFRQDYANLESVLDCVKAPLNKYGISLIQIVTYEDSNQFLVTRLTHTSGQSIESKMLLVPKENTPQSMGALLTYFRRYAISALCCITQGAERDDDGESAINRITPEQAQELVNAIGGFKELKTQVLKIAEVDSFENISKGKLKVLHEVIDRYKKSFSIKISGAEMQNIQLALEGHPEIAKDLLSYLGIGTLDDIPKHKYASVMKGIESKLQAKEQSDERNNT